MMEKSVAAKGTTGGGVQTTKKTPMKSTKKKSENARDSSIDRSDVLELQPEPSPVRSMKERGTHVPISKIPVGVVVCVFG